MPGTVLGQTIHESSKKGIKSGSYKCHMENTAGYGDGGLVDIFMENQGRPLR